MNQNYTSITPSRKRVRRTFAQPSGATLEFLRNFARTYTPNEKRLGEKSEMILG